MKHNIKTLVLLALLFTSNTTIASDLTAFEDVMSSKIIFLHSAPELDTHLDYDDHWKSFVSKMLQCGFSMTSLKAPVCDDDNYYIKDASKTDEQAVFVIGHKNSNNMQFVIQIPSETGLFGNSGKLYFHIWKGAYEYKSEDLDYYFNYYKDGSLIEEVASTKYIKYPAETIIECFMDSDDCPDNINETNFKTLGLLYLFENFTQLDKDEQENMEEITINFNSYFGAIFNNKADEIKNAKSFLNIFKYILNTNTNINFGAKLKLDLIKFYKNSKNDFIKYKIAVAALPSDFASTSRSDILHIKDLIKNITKDKFTDEEIGIQINKELIDKLKVTKNIPVELLTDIFEMTSSVFSKNDSKATLNYFSLLNIIKVNQIDILFFKELIKKIIINSHKLPETSAAKILIQINAILEKHNDYNSSTGTNLVLKIYQYILSSGSQTNYPVTTTLIERNLSLEQELQMRESFATLYKDLSFDVFSSYLKRQKDRSDEYYQFLVDSSSIIHTKFMANYMQILKLFPAHSKDGQGLKFMIRYLDNRDDLSYTTRLRLYNEIKQYDLSPSQIKHLIKIINKHSLEVPKNEMYKKYHQYVTPEIMKEEIAIFDLPFLLTIIPDRSSINDQLKISKIAYDKVDDFNIDIRKKFYEILIDTQLDPNIVLALKLILKDHNLFSNNMSIPLVEQLIPLTLVGTGVKYKKLRSKILDMLIKRKGYSTLKTLKLFKKDPSKRLQSKAKKVYRKILASIKTPSNFKRAYAQSGYQDQILILKRLYLLDKKEGLKLYISSLESDYTYVRRNASSFLLKNKNLLKSTHYSQLNSKLISIKKWRIRWNITKLLKSIGNRTSLEILRKRKKMEKDQDVLDLLNS